MGKMVTGFSCRDKMFCELLVCPYFTSTGNGEENKESPMPVLSGQPDSSEDDWEDDDSDSKSDAYSNTEGDDGPLSRLSLYVRAFDSPFALSDHSCVRFRHRTEPVQRKVRPKFFNSHGRTRNRARASLERMKQAQLRQLETFRGKASSNDWGSIHHDHFGS